MKARSGLSLASHRIVVKIDLDHPADAALVAGVCGLAGGDIVFQDGGTPPHRGGRPR